MKVLLVHNRYQLPGGEDVVFARERDLLRDAGHQVIEYVRSNNEIAESGPWGRAAIALKTIWSWETERELRGILAREKPHVAHFHNTFPLVSPAAFYACRDAGVPAVQTLHNARLVCPGADLTRDGRPCEDCVGKLPWRGIVHGCYRDSRVETTVVAAAMSFHRSYGTWRDLVSTYIVPTEFYRSRFIQGGIPAHKIVVKPHFVSPDPGVAFGGDYALFIGRLAPEKGVKTMIAAWRSLADVPLKIVGEGPLRGDVLDFMRERGHVDLISRLDRAALVELIKGARFLVWPSEGYYETFGLVAIEAFACGVPVIASDTGVMKEMVKDAFTGLHFVAGDPESLAQKVRWAWEHPSQLVAMGHNARANYEAKYTDKDNYEMLMSIYARESRAA